MKKHRVRNIILISLLVLLLAAAAVVWALFGAQLRAVHSITKRGDGLWTMEYRGDYGFDAFLAQGGAAKDDQLGEYVIRYLTRGLIQGATVAPGNFGCSVMTVQSPDGAALYGRNYDWESCDALIVHTVPKNGYASVSSCCLSFVGDQDGLIPDQDFESRFTALAAVYVPVDGMNEKGLCVADLLVEPGEAVHQKTDRPDLTITAAIRLLLDHAATTDEAIALLQQYDINSSAYAAHHFAISDASGNSVVVEYVQNKMVVTETPIVTNHYVNDLEGLPAGKPSSRDRYQCLANCYAAADGSMTADALCEAMAQARASLYGSWRTQWTMVCEPESRTLRLWFDEDYSTPLTVTLTGKKWQCAMGS